MHLFWAFDGCKEGRKSSVEKTINHNRRQLQIWRVNIRDYTGGCVYSFLTSGIFKTKRNRLVVQRLAVSNRSTYSPHIIRWISTKCCTDTQVLIQVLHDISKWFGDPLTFSSSSFLNFVEFDTCGFQWNVLKTIERIPLKSGTDIHDEL